MFTGARIRPFLWPTLGRDLPARGPGLSPHSLGALLDEWIGGLPGGRGAGDLHPALPPCPSPPARRYRASETRANSLEQHGAAHGRAQHGQRQNVAAHAWPEWESDCSRPHSRARRQPQERAARAPRAEGRTPPEPRDSGRGGAGPK